jgi:uncharacterized integral membrane protein
VTAPVALVVVLFAVSNRASVTVTLWPLPVTLAAPLYFVVLAALLLGFLVGGLVTWINAGRVRRTARERARRIAALERDLAASEARLAAAAPPVPARIDAGA